MPVLLEVIVTSVAEAIEAERGGADRLELVCAFGAGGLTPPPPLVDEVLKAVNIPVRVMVRENSSLSLQDEQEFSLLRERVREFSKLPVDGLVLGFANDGELDLATMRALIEEAPHCRATFHRAFDALAYPETAIRELKGLAQIDRILTAGGTGSEAERIARLRRWQEIALPGIRILTAVGLSPSMIECLKQEPSLSEVHIGRAARVPQDETGAVYRIRVAALKSTLA